MRVILVAAAAFVVVTLPAAGAPPLEFPARLPERALAVPILEYHRIDDVRPGEPPVTRRLTVATRVFAAQMEWLHAQGFHALTQEQLFAALEWRRPLPPRPILITFDDGYRDVLLNAAPVLVHLHMPATAYVITDRISGPDPSFLTWDDLRLLERRGFDIGSHTVDHLPLTELEPAQAWRDLAASRAILQDRLGRPVDWLAYPRGAEDPQVVALARRAGYLLAVTSQPGPLQDAREPLLLRRYEILHGVTAAGLASLLGR